MSRSSELEFDAKPFEVYSFRIVCNWADEAMFGNFCRAIGLGSGEMSWLRSIALRTLLRIEELVWRLDHRVGFCNNFKKRARHIVQPKPALVAVTASAWHRCCRSWPPASNAEPAASPLLRLCGHVWQNRLIQCLSGVLVFH